MENINAKTNVANALQLELLHGVTLSTIRPHLSLSTPIQWHTTYMETKSENQELATSKDLSYLKIVNSLLKSRNFAQKLIGNQLEVPTSKPPIIVRKSLSSLRRERYRNNLKRRVQRLELKLQKINGELLAITQRKEILQQSMLNIPSSS